MFPHTSDSSSVVQGMITNDVEKLKQSSCPVLYAAILNAQGRQLHDIFLHKDPSEQLGHVAWFRCM